MQRRRSPRNQSLLKVNKMKNSGISRRSSSINGEAGSALAPGHVTPIHEVEHHDSDNTHYTVDAAISAMGVGWFQYRLCFLTGAINAADAMEMMLLSFLIPKLKEEWDLSPPWDGFMGAVVFLGQLLGTSSGALMADTYGRRIVTVGSTVGCAIFGTLSAFAYNLPMMLFFRFLVGFFVGGSCSAYTLFAEYCPTHQRGSLLVIEQSFWAFGAIFSVCLAWICFSEDFLGRSDHDWRYYLFLTAIPLWIISAFYHMVPESPRYYVATGNTAMAQKMLENVAKINGKPLPKGKLFKVPTASNGKSAGSLRDIFAEQYRHTSIMLYITFWCCVFGYYGISFLSERYFSMFGSASGEGSNLYFEMAVSTISEIPSLFLGMFMLDRFGRKYTMQTMFGVFAVCCLTLSAYQKTGYLGLFGVFTARMSISLSFMALFVYFSEYYPTVIRSTALGCASACGRFAGILTSFIAQDLSIPSALFIYGIGGIVAFVCSGQLRQDTLGKDMATTVAPQRSNQKYRHIDSAGSEDEHLCMIQTTS